MPSLQHGPRRALALAACAALAATAHANHPEDPAAQRLDRVNVTGSRPTSLPIEIPTTTEGLTGAQVEQRINATDSADALKYLPSLVVRKRHIGDHDHAVLASRASGTGNSARSMVYADGILLSNLLGNGAQFTPRWGLVTPEEIERVDVLYGPFSAAYPGNSAGAIVDFVTRMPERFEAHAKLKGFFQDYKLHGSDARYRGGQGSLSLGSREGAFAWWLALDRLDNEGQPLVIVRGLRPPEPSAVGTPVTGGVPGRDPLGRAVFNFGSSTQTETRQEHAKLKLAYDLTPTLRASYTLGHWANDAERHADTLLRNGAGQPVYAGTVNIDGRSYALGNTSFTESRGRFEHVAHGLTLKSHTRGHWDWELAASHYDYATDKVSTSGTALPAAREGGAGRLVDGGGSGWTTLAAKGLWRPAGLQGAHLLEFGAQRDAFRLRSREFSTSDWTRDANATLASRFEGETVLTSLWAQDTWRFAPGWRAVLGGRFERWQARDGERQSGSTTVGYDERDAQHVSPKAAIGWSVNEDWTLKASVGRAVRYPTVSELYQGGVNTTTGLPTNNDPGLKPEKSVTAEFSAERLLEGGLWRSTLFLERSRDALYSQPDARFGGANTVQNVGRIDTVGLEIAVQAQRVLLPGLDLQASLTWADSEIKENDALPASVGKRQPRVPAWRGSFLASYAFTDRLQGSFGARYSGTQYGQLDNSDTNGFSYQGFSRYFVTDLRMQYRLDRQWRASFGIDNLGNERYWAFHPYPQRTFHAELRYDH
jgi:iron complex outermembrane receptor protein